MKSRPILFSGPMVRAIIDGRKTQTRRVVKPRPREVVFGYNVAPHTVFYDGNSEAIQRHYCCPYGQPGDLLWVRETHYVAEGMRVIYRADEPDASVNWTPSIHMPRWASRLTLRITNVRVERVRAMMNVDAKAEGITHYVTVGPDQDGRYYQDRVEPFRDLWDSINAKRGYSWESNPWVWVVKFEVIRSNIDDVIRDVYGR